ncbi:MAG: hypothetical protein QOH73_838 [Gaiellaceae bacterium]|nr:hypothetical protein [Gaiellaceae bacterium]
MNRLLTRLAAVALFVVLGLAVLSAWGQWVPAPVRAWVGIALGVACIGRVILFALRWLASDDFEGEVWEREHAFRSGRRP